MRWLVAPAMRDELRHVLGRGIAARYAPDLANSSKPSSTPTPCPSMTPQPQPLATARLTCRDPDDQKFIDLALARAMSGG